ncbi:MAG: hypothetical protein JWN86_1516 [Planctomycetota bacterium]|nr:hypothetical protein [Planctomycetota bacterium]
MAALDQPTERAQKIDRQWQLARERVRDEAELAERRFKAVDPENRLVARSLERDRNEKLTEVERLDRENLQRPSMLVRLVDPKEPQRILALAQDLPRLWHAATTTNVERKQLPGFLIKDVTLFAGETTIEISIRWQTEARTALEVPRFRRMMGSTSHRSGRDRVDPHGRTHQVRCPDRHRTEREWLPLWNQERVQHFDLVPASLSTWDRERMPRPPSILSRGKARRWPLLDASRG